MRNIYTLLLVMLICGCATIYNPATQKDEFIFINTQAEISLGKSMLKQLHSQIKISKDKALNARLKTIGRNICNSSHRQDLDYEFFVVEDKELNAFAIPGGFVFINSGLMKVASDDELACVVGHEVGHIAARHSVKRLQAGLGYSILMSIAFGRGGYVNIARALDIVFNVVSLGYSRADERLADKLAVTYAYGAGYDPEGMITFFSKLNEAGKKRNNIKPLVFLSSHPAIEERIKNTRANIDVLTGKVKTDQDINTSRSLSDKNICPKCKRTYPNQYNYCTKDGTRLQ